MADTLEIMLWSKIAGPVQKIVDNTKGIEVLKYDSHGIKVKFSGQQFMIKVEKNE